MRKFFVLVAGCDVESAAMNIYLPSPASADTSALPATKSEFLVRQAKSGESSWLRSQLGKVSRPSKPSIASMQVTVWVKRKQGASRP
jgi:hypothetical protein